MQADLFGEVPAAVVRPAEDLKALACLITNEIVAGEMDMEDAEEAARRGLDHYRRAGEALLKAKAFCPHGTWLRWLKENVAVSQQQASRYMQLAKLPVTSNLAEEWRRISGNAPAPIEEGHLGNLDFAGPPAALDCLEHVLHFGRAHGGIGQSPLWRRLIRWRGRFCRGRGGNRLGGCRRHELLLGSLDRRQVGIDDTPGIAA